MLLIIVLALLDFGSSFDTKECYGSHYSVPFQYTYPVFKGPIYYKPRGEEQKIVVMDGQPRHNRFSVTYGRIRMKDLTEQDNQGELIFGGISSVKLVINDCQEPQSSSYGDLFSWRLPSGAEYMEFSRMTSSGLPVKPEVIWNRTDASLGRGTVKRSYYELYNLKQKDSGYYKFMGSQGDLISWKRLKVKEYTRNVEHKEGENLKAYFPVKFSALRRILFTSLESGYEQTIDKEDMDYRMELTDSYFSIMNLNYEDSGTYKLVDDDGFMALRLELEVDYPQLPAWVYVMALVILVLCIVCCCCCVKKCCCKKSSNKRNSPQTEAAAPRVFYHDTTQPTQPVIPLLSRAPRVNTAVPLPYNTAVGNIDQPTLIQVTVPEGLGPTSTAVNPTSSNSEPKFEFRGTVFPSALPLSSGTSIQDVYTSDKLNFL